MRGRLGLPGLRFRKGLLGNARAQGGNERMTGYSWRRGCPDEKRSRCLKRNQRLQAGVAEPGRGEGMEQPSEEPSRPLEALCYGGSSWAGWRATFTRAQRAVQLVVPSLSSSSQCCRKGICSSTEPPKRSLPSLPAVPAQDGVGERGRGQSCRDKAQPGARGRLGAEPGAQGSLDSDPAGGS